MIKSMTGFGKEAQEIGSKKFSIEIRSLNSKQLDLNVRIPGIYKEKELELRSAISKKLERGKIDLFVNYENLKEEKVFQLNHELINRYYTDIKEAAVAAGINDVNGGDYLPIIMRMPEIMKTERQELDEEEWQEIVKLIETAIARLTDFRTQEGASLEKDFRMRIETIDNLLTEIESFEDDRIERIRERVRKNLEDFVKDEKVDRNRFEQEMIYYLEKLDVTEEKVRLNQHLKYFIETIEAGGSNGKKLGFITQEIGREINTIGSKANDSEIQKRVVLMKDELEKIKEQVLNVL